MAHGLNSVLKRGSTSVGCKTESPGKTGIGSRRIFAPHFKLQVLDSYRNDADCKGNQRATARKYGIHRRQIQKWLQVENNLRNSVVQNAKSNLNEDKGTHEVRVPSLAVSAPLDFTTHHRGSPRVASPGASPPPPADPAAPMDLSLKRPAAMLANAPATRSVPSPPRLLTPPSLLQPHPDVWDLSTKRKYEEDTTSTSSSNTTTRCDPKPVKLFKPYLDDVFDNTTTTTTSSSSTTSTPDEPFYIKQEPILSCCNNSYINCESSYYYHNNNNNNNNNIHNNNHINNNNNICDVKSEMIGNNYTLHELQPKSTISYYYHPLHSSGNYQGSDYEINSFYEDPNYGVVPIKQRHNYSLDFKLSAIECYYQDTMCKGNQRAVASKYNIHRRQVQKWLKQADELRQKNETIKHTQLVR